MIKITIACVGKVKESWMRSGIAEYEKRLSRYCRLETLQVADEKTPDGASAAEENAIKKKEGCRLLAGIPERAFVIALEIGGKRLDSVAFSRELDRLAASGCSHLVFVIGGSLGLSDQVLKRANMKISFSDMTFPHQLMRIILLEQVYRGFRIINREPYHK